MLDEAPPRERSAAAVQPPPLRHEDLGYSLRRYFVDAFHFREVARLPAGCRVLDLGGHKLRKRGQFDIGRFPLSVVYADLTAAKAPDVRADAARIPFRGAAFDAVICSELLEHVPDPALVVAEVSRVLRPGGTLLVCVPFLHRVHGDPYDFGRYTDAYWRRVLERAGFEIVTLEQQGLLWSVVVDLLRGYAQHLGENGRPRSPWLRRALAWLVAGARRRALAWEAHPRADSEGFLRSATTGYGIVARRL